MPTVAPQPVAFWPRPCPGRRRPGSSPAQRSFRILLFSTVAGFLKSSITRLRDRGWPIIRLLSPPSLGGVVQIPTVVVVFDLDLAGRALDLLPLVRGGVADDEVPLAAAPFDEVVAEPVHHLSGMQNNATALLLH